MSKYQVIVGNVGTVYDGDNGFEANRIFGQYKVISKNSRGRVSDESVTLMENGEVKYSYDPPNAVRDR